MGKLVRRTRRKTVGTRAGRHIPILNSEIIDAERRAFLRKSFLSCLSISAAPILSGCDDSDAGVFEQLFEAPAVPPGMSNVDNLGPLGAADANGLMLPEGFLSVQD